MISEPSRPAPSLSNGRRRSIVVALSLAIWLAASLGTVACDKVPLLAPTQSTIKLFVASRVIPINGATEIVATVLEQAGTPVQNGTVVTFTSTLGTLEPREARTEGGKATVRLVSSGQSGTATVQAFSGNAKAEPVEVRIGGAAAARVVLSATPGTVPASGGSVQLIAVVIDDSGNRLAGVPVIFTAGAGVLAQGTVTTDQNGEARNTLTTSRETIVTATAGSQQAQLTVAILLGPTVSITAPTTTPSARQPASFLINVAPGGGATGAPIVNVRVDFGDGSALNLGTVTGSITVAHVYDRGGTYIVTVTATDAGGQQTAVSSVLSVNEPAPLNVNLTASSTSPKVNTVVQFTASVTSAGGGSASVDRFEWEFIKNGIVLDRVVTTGSATTHVFGSTGHWVIRVTVVGTFGSVGRSQLEIVVEP